MNPRPTDEEGKKGRSNNSRKKMATASLGDHLTKIENAISVGAIEAQTFEASFISDYSAFSLTVLCNG